MTRGWFLLVWVNCPPIFKGMLDLTYLKIYVDFIWKLVQEVINPS